MPVLPVNNNLTQIQQMVRFLTKSPQEDLLSSDTINQWINTFILYDFPQHLRLFDLHETFTWYCQPNIDTYNTDLSVTPITNPLYNFQNLYISVNPPVYVAGYQVGYYQSRELFYRNWPQVDSIVQINAGDGVTTVYTGSITPVPFLQNYVLISSVDTNGNGISIIDQPIDSQTGNLIAPTNVPTAPNIVGTINYVTGAYTFNTALLGQTPALGVAINAQVYSYVAARPLSILWFDNKFVLRPVPDQPYQINIEVYKRPDQLLATNSIPKIEEWYQYIAYGAARKILQMVKFDYDSLALIEPEFQKQQELVLRKTVVQNTTQRTYTIYASGLGQGNDSLGNWNGFGQSGV